MKREFSFVQMGLSLIAMTLWFVLPIFSFVVIVPLFNVSGWNLCMHINQMMLIPLVVGMIMLIGALINNRTMMIASGLIQVVCIILTVVFRKEILLEGNLKWIYSSAQLLLKAIPNLEVSGVQINAENLREVVTLIVNNYMQMGLGLILHGLSTLVYVLISFAAPEEKKPFTAGGAGSGSAGTTASFAPSKKTGYNHRT